MLQMNILNESLLNLLITKYSMIFKLKTIIETLSIEQIEFKLN